jgi:hypothetical protein
MSLRSMATAHRRIPYLTITVAFLFLTRVHSLASVQVELVIPPAQTHVIGDHTPLIWRFLNVGTEPVAFTWEGCCRLNGRLTVIAPGQTITPIPPVQTLAHAFAKAEILQPGQPSEFSTRISDWVQLHDTGTYQLQGHYTGVLPDQRPQVPSSLKLWRDAAHTPAVQFTVLNVADYLAQRAQRSAQRQIALQIEGPSRLEPLETSPLTVTIRNVADTTQRLRWPNDLQLWLVNPAGLRLGLVPTYVDGPYEEIVLPPGARTERRIPFDHTRLEGEPFATYQVFVDLQPDADQPRVPSNVIDVHWHLDASRVAELIRQAAQGPRMGLRNPALKLLRVYLAEIGPCFDQIQFAPTSNPEVRTLHSQLQLASRLKPFAPDPGRVHLTLAIRANEPGRFIGPMIEANAAFLPTPPDAVLESMMAVRRHLGWEIALNVQPSSDTTLAQIGSTLAPLQRLNPDLAAPPRAFLANDRNDSGPTVTFRTQPIRAHLLVRLEKSGHAAKIRFATKSTASGPLSKAALFEPADIATASFRPASDSNALNTILDSTSTPPQTLVLAHPHLTWAELTNALEAFRTRRLPVDCVLLPGP